MPPHLGLGLALGTGNSPGAAAFDPTTITGLAVWLDATSLTQAGGLVTAIANKYGPATATINAGEEPAYSAAAAAYGNRPTFTGGLVRITGHGLTTNPRTIVIVGQCADSGAFFRDAGSNTLLQGGGGAGDKWQATSTTAKYLYGGVSATPCVVIVVLNGATSKIYTTSLTPTTGDTDTIRDLTGVQLRLGNAASPVTQFLIYDGDKSANAAALLNGFGAQSGLVIAP